VLLRAFGLTIASLPLPLPPTATTTATPRKSLQPPVRRRALNVRRSLRRGLIADILGARKGPCMALRESRVPSEPSLQTYIPGTHEGGYETVLVYQLPKEPRRASAREFVPPAEGTGERWASMLPSSMRPFKPFEPAAFQSAACRNPFLRA
jgi:hypothetical protein